jgi:hypothetical protein
MYSIFIFWYPFHILFYYILFYLILSYIIFNFIIFNTITKINFYIDTGCDLDAEKDYENMENIYDHNFEGRFCLCESSEIEAMLQCLICEDWYHENCIKINEVRTNIYIILFV